jgi:hypothetical protein
LAKLTQADERLILYPPTETTWECNRTRTVIQDGEPAEYTCKAKNAGHVRNCVICTKPKARNAKLVWPRYLEACRKAGVEPRKESGDE